MSNTLTGLIPTLYEALDVVSRELVGFIPACTLDTSVARAAVGQTVMSFVAPAATSTAITPGVTPPNDGDQTIGNLPFTITRAQRVPIRWNGEDTRGVNNNGPGQRPIFVQQCAQAIRTLTNFMESDLAVAAALGASRAVSPASSTLFSTNLADPANLRKVLSDNGSPLSDLQMVIGTTEGAAMRTLTQLTKANEAADTTMLRQGTLLDIHGFQIRESAQVVAPAIGTLAGSPTTNTAGYTKGATVINLAAAGTGTIIAGDIVKFAGDPNQYVVNTGIASLAAGGAITLALPGLQQALPASAQGVSIKASGNRNVGFNKAALALFARLPALPDGGDLAVDRSTIVDPRTGFAFEIAMYPQYRQMQYEISAAWGVGVTKAEHIAILSAD